MICPHCDKPIILKRSPITTEMRRKILELRKMKYSYPDISKMLSISVTTAYRSVKDYQEGKGKVNYVGSKKEI